jgi:hypothetical protein
LRLGFERAPGPASRGEKLARPRGELVAPCESGR